MIDATDITALVLAGGKGRRMGGRDKGLLPYGDGLLIGHIIDAIRPQVGGVMISANRNQAAYSVFYAPVLGDPIEGFQGPLAGFLAGLQACRSSYMLTLPCDGPVVVPDLARRLADAIEENGADIAVAHDGRRLQPVYAMLHVRTLASLRDVLAKGERKIDRWYPLNHWIEVDCSDIPEQFGNINTPDDYSAACGMPLEAVDQGNG